MIPLTGLTDAINSSVTAFLLSSRGRDGARRLQTADLHEANTLLLLTSLRRDYSAQEAGALLALARLRQRAATKFPFAEQLFFTSEALEQATAWPVADHHAQWIDRFAPTGPVLDLGCGIGGDTLALARYRPVIAVDVDPVRLGFAQANAEALGLAGQITFLQADWTTLVAENGLPPASAAFADPARRVGEKRIFSLHQVQPPLRELLRLQQQIPHVGIKVMPGVEDAELPADCGVEFISHEGVCKEAVLWFGALAQGGRWASVHTGSAWQQLIARGAPPPLGELKAGQFLHEPDPAVIRAGALAELCDQLAAHLFDAEIAYLLSEDAQNHPLVQSFVVQEIHPFSLKRLNQRLRALRIGEVELKKRGFPAEPEGLRRRLKLTPDGQSATVIFTRQRDERLMLICERVTRNA